MVAERIIEQFSLIEPGGMDWREARPPPRVVVKVLSGGRGGMTGIIILDQKDAAQVTMALVKRSQNLDVMGCIFPRGAVRFHLAAMYHQKHQHVDRAMAHVFKLLLLNRAGNGLADRGAFERLQIGHLIHTNDPKPTMHQALSIGITPENLLSTGLKLRIQARGFAVTGTMRLQVNLLQQAAYGARADGRHDPV